MLVGVLDRRTSTFEIKDGRKKWLIPVPPDGLTVTTIRGDGLPERTYIPHNPAMQTSRHHTALLHQRKFN
jgi:hypothetical protein